MLARMGSSWACDGAPLRARPGMHLLASIPAGEPLVRVVYMRVSAEGPLCFCLHLVVCILGLTPADSDHIYVYRGKAWACLESAPHLDTLDFHQCCLKQQGPLSDLGRVRLARSSTCCHGCNTQAIVGSQQSCGRSPGIAQGNAKSPKISTADGFAMLRS